ncbi:MAG: peptidylprolyl isomerase [Euryarchaeota archaeon]|nr:peptidylprolyl isomerase [Euryarchaeota archaeon]
MKKLALILILASMVLVSGCSGPTSTQEDVVKEGDLIQVNYVGELEDGSIFDTSIEEIAKGAGDGVYNPDRAYEPLEFTVGAGQMIRGFDNGVIGMASGEEKTVTIPPEDAYGLHSEERVVPVTIESLTASNITPTVGMTLYTPYGQEITIVDVNDTHAMLDHNHPLAGKELTFKITLVSIHEQTN